MDDDGDDGDGILWEDPPPLPYGAKGRRGSWRQILEPFIAHPRRWGVVPVVLADKEVAIKIQSDLRAGRRKPPNGRWEFTVREVAGVVRLYARYLGEAEAAAKPDA